MVIERFITAVKWIVAASFIPLAYFVYAHAGVDEHDSEFLFGVLFIAADVTLLLWLCVWAYRQPRLKAPPKDVPGDW